MKKLLTILCLVLLVSCSQESDVVEGPFLKRDGVLYFQKTNVKVNGVVDSYYTKKNVFLLTRETYKDGLRDGLWESFHPHEDGQLKERGNYIDGKKDGLWEGFYKNGQLEIRETYNEGKLEGLRETYYKNGRLKWRTTYKNGEKDGLWEYFDENGQLHSSSPRCYRKSVVVKMSYCEN